MADNENELETGATALENGSTPTDAIPQPQAEDPPPGDAPPEGGAALVEWNKKRQAEDQERSNSEKKLQAQRLQRVEETQTQILETLKTLAPKPPVQVDELDEADALDAQALLLENGDDKTAPDPDEARNLRHQASLKRSAAIRKDRQQVREIATRPSPAANGGDFFDRVSTEHKVPKERAVAWATEAHKMAASNGLKEGTNDYNAAVKVVFNDRMSAFKKSNPNPTTTSSSRSSTVTAAGGNAPANGKVIPVESGARTAANQLSDVKRRMAGHFAEAKRT